MWSHQHAPDAWAQSDHSKLECALTSLKLQYEPSYNHTEESARQPGPSRQGRESAGKVLPSQIPSPISAFLLMRANASDTQSLVIGSRCSGDHRMVECKAAVIPSSSRKPAWLGLSH